MSLASIAFPTKSLPPQKRIATDNDAPASRPIVQLHIGGSGGNRGSRQSSEEWPNRMGGLRIDSPMISSGAPSENGEDDAMDVAMVRSTY